MTAHLGTHIGTMSIDGTPISEADMARIEAEEQLHGKQRRAAVRVVAAGALDAADCRQLLDILGLDTEIVTQARLEQAARPAPKRARKGNAAAAA